MAEMEAGDMEDEITLQEALDAQDLQEKQSVAVLGASDPENCSYAKGYMKRQALYACLTCNPKGAPFAKQAGICLACSYTCHEGHDLVELFTKRHFRCDCGNKKFPDNPCRLQTGKDDFNSENVYNQNYSGVYCSCHRPYPDSENDTEVAEDSMIQCIICEDWHHFQHCLGYLNVDLDAVEEDWELICGPCMNRLDFLCHYTHLALKPKTITDISTCDEAVENSDQQESQTGDANNTEVVNAAKDHIEDTSSKDSGVDSLTGSENSSDVSTCQLHKREKGTLQFSAVQGVAWKGTLRTSLCQCPTCMGSYEKLKVQFLLDPEDTIEHYEALGKKRSEDAKMSAEASINNHVDQLGHVGQLELVHGYNYLKDKLADFMREHADNGRTVRREDVENLFAKINEEVAANKRRRLE